MMGKYYVELPITGIVLVEDIEADSEEQAIEKAMQADINNEMITEWETHEAIITGNVFYGLLNEAEATEEG